MLLNAPFALRATVTVVRSLFMTLLRRVVIRRHRPRPRPRRRRRPHRVTHRVSFIRHRE